MRRRWIVLLLVVVMAAVAALPLWAQRGRRMWFGYPAPLSYDGRFTIVRLWYPYYEGWAYDWPEMEQNLSAILREISAVRPNPNGSSIFKMDDPELLKHPIAYLSEPGYWHPSESEVHGLRDYLVKGGFLIVDDFHFANEWAVFESAMRQVLPGAEVVRLDLTHPVFNTFFSIQSLEVPYPGRLGQMGLMGEFYGIHEDNDLTKRLMVAINYNMDIGDYMEHSASGRFAVDPTNEAYKFMINYLAYGLTH